MRILRHTFQTTQVHDLRLFLVSGNAPREPGRIPPALHVSSPRRRHGLKAWNSGLELISCILRVMLSP